MLQQPGDSPSVKVFADTIRRLEEAGGTVEGAIRGFLDTPGRRIIAYYRQGYLPASILYWMISTLNDWAETLFGEAGTLAYYTLAYSEPSTTILFSTAPASPATIQFLQSASLTGCSTTLLTVSVENEMLRDTLAQYNTYYLPIRDELEASLAYAFAAYRVAAQKYSDRLGRRGRRLRAHSTEGFAAITPSLIEKYADTVREILSLEKLTVTSTGINEAAAHYMVEALRRRNINAYYEPLEYASGPGDILLIASSVEEYLLRERRRSIMLTGGRLHELLFNTDPLETPLYSAIISLYVSGGKDN